MGDGDTLMSHRSIMLYKYIRKSFKMVLYSGHVYIGVWAAQKGGSLTCRLCSGGAIPP